MLTTQTSQSVNITGTPPYMAPEAFDGKRNAQTDIWSVGVISYYLLGGQLPFSQQDITSLIGAIAGKDPAPLPMHLPANLKSAVFGALVKNPEHRFKSAASMRAALKMPNERSGAASVPLDEADEVATVVNKRLSETTRKTVGSVQMAKDGTKELRKVARSASLRKAALLFILGFFALGLLAGLLRYVGKEAGLFDTAALQPSNERIANTPRKSNTISPQTPESKTPKPTSSKTVEEPRFNPPQDQVASNIPQREYDSEMLQAARNKARDLHPASNFESSYVSKQGENNNTYTFLMRGSILGKNRFRVIINVEVLGNRILTTVEEDQKIN